MLRIIILCLVIIIFEADARDLATDNPVIHLRYGHNDNEHYTVLKDKPLKIVIENGKAKYYWCFRIYYINTTNNGKAYEQFVNETEIDSDLNNVIIHVKNVTAKMSTRWACTILQKYHGPKRITHKYRNYTGINLYFNLHVKGAKSVLLTANNHSLTFVTTNLTADYDGDARYTYEDHEDIEVSCARPQDDSLGSVHLEYFNAEGNLLFRTKLRETEPHIFRSVMKSKNNKYYLDCIYTTKNPVREYRYRTTFFKKKRDANAATQHAVTLSVNGQELPLILNDRKQNGDYGFYRYRYIDGEILNVTCQNINNVKTGSLLFYYDIKDIPSAGKVIGSPLMGKIMISLNTTKLNLNKKTLICKTNNTDVLKPEAKLLFMSDVAENEVRILGLPRNNILYQYTNNLRYWTTEYQYSANDTLNLNCVSRGVLDINRRYKWKFQDETIDSEPVLIGSTMTMISTKFTKILDATHDGSKIICIQNRDSFNIHSEVILRLKLEEASEAVSVISGPEDMLLIIPVSVVIIIAIIMMVCLVYWRKRTKDANLIENAYENLSNQDDSPIPTFPSQWESNYDDSHYTKIDEGVTQENHTYETDKDKSYIPNQRQSNNSEDHYTEIDEYFKPKFNKIEANLNNTKPPNYNKGRDRSKGSVINNFNNASSSKFDDSRQSSYDTLRHSNVSSNDLNTHNKSGYVQRNNKTNNVAIRKENNDVRPVRNYRKTDQGVNQNGEGLNMSKHIYMQPGIMQRKPDYENHFIESDKSNNSMDTDYAEPYGELEVSCKNECYGQL